MKTVMCAGWPVTISCTVNCARCGVSNVDSSCGAPSETVRSAKRNGWRLIDGLPACGACAERERQP